jgi:acetyl esterase/lipase
MNSESILSIPPPKADERLHYGSDPQQFADLRRPSSKGPHPILVFLHGGFWRAKYDLTHAGHLCAALTAKHVATWNMEYRRVGNPGGGWPGTFEDITNGLRFVSQIAHRYGLDVKRIVIMGHSAGGQLALALAAHQHTIRHSISLAGVVDLQRAFELHLSNDAVVDFMGGSPQQVPEHYHEASPIGLPMPHVRQLLVHGDEDDTVPVALSRSYREVKLKRGEKVDLLELPKAGHYELIDPRSSVWPAVQEKTLELLA